MKFIRKKVIKNKPYYYFEASTKVGAKRTVMSRYLGTLINEGTKNVVLKYLNELAQLTTSQFDESTVKYFAPKLVLNIEQSRFWYQALHHELFAGELELFQTLFAALFILNSNKSEGSKATRKDIEKVIQRRRKPKTLIDYEVLDSLDALNFAFSKNMKWNVITLKKIHLILMRHLAPEIAGQFKKVDNIVNDQPTTEWQRVRKELKALFTWFNKNRKKLYPPIVALIFHYRFEHIHPFEDGNGRIGRILANAYLLQSGYMPTIFFSENHGSYCNAIQQAKEGRPHKLAHYFIEQIKKTRVAIEAYKKEGVLRGGSSQVGHWEIERGKIRKY